MEELPQMAPNGARRFLFPTNPDVADILGRMDLDFDNLYFWDLLEPRFLEMVPRSQHSPISRDPGSHPALSGARIVGALSPTYQDQWRFLKR